MQLTRHLGLLLAGLAACVGGPAAACTLTLNTGGTLALSADATRFGSDEAGGIPATFTVLNLSLGEATVTVDPRPLDVYPSGFDAGATRVYAAYSGVGLLAGVNRAYVSHPTSFKVPGLLSLAVIMTVNNRITSSKGFASGTYQTRTVITCS